MQLPKDFEVYTRELMGETLYATLEKGLDSEAPTSIRLNPFKRVEDDDRKAVDRVAGAREAVAWCAEGVYLNERPNFTFDPLLHAGRYYVQEASSMFVCHILRELVHDPVLMLDLCAAPGGKTTAARSVLPQGSVLLTNEPMKLRASILSENVQKFGHPDVLVTNNFPRDYRKTGLLFDVVLADVPCSGEGMFRKDEGAIGEWSMQNVENCRTLQRSIVEDIWPCLREGGLLIYSTCTFNAHEDEENVNWIAETLGADFVEIETRPEWNIIGSLTDQHPVYRFIPGKTQGEGLFVAVLRKHGDQASALRQMCGEAGKGGGKSKKDKAAKGKTAELDHVTGQWLTGDYKTIELRDTRLAIPSAWLSVYEKAAKALHILYAGVGLGTMKGRDLVPDASLALSIAIRREAFPQIDVDYPTAISYLRKEAIVLPENTPRGFVLVTFGHQPLGFVKNIGNRANNLYPQEWKIKSTHAPEQPVEVIKMNP
ncbi:MAG: hypothetical protein I3J02_10765 [Prevotella sp.]|nr:hypothetical protein [Prevotella sp.]